jgi:hypothetical protein
MKWKRGEGLKVEEQAASTFSSQNMERDAPWTAWDRMSQPHEEAGSSFKIQNSKSNIPPLPSAFLCDLGGFAVNLLKASAPRAASPYRN